MGGGYHTGRVSYAGGGGSTNSTLGQYQDSTEDTTKKKVFIIHSMRDKAHVELLRYQIGSDKYELQYEDTSLRQPIVNRSWKPPVGYKIENSDAVICLVGEDTYSRSAVSWELNYAYEHDIPVIPVIIPRDKHVRIPEPIKREGDKTITWNLKDIQYCINNTS